MDKDVKCTRLRNKVLAFFNDLLELEPLQIQIDDVTYQKLYFCSWLEVGKRKNKWFIKLRISTKVLSRIYPYTLPVILLTYKKKSELAIKLQIIESINVISNVKEFEMDKTYRDLSLSSRAIQNRQTMILQIFKELKTDKIIHNNISVSFKDISKKEICLKMDKLKPNMLREINKISFTQRFD